MIQKIRANFTRKVALISVFALVLTGSGLASLATLVDTGRATFNASVTTIAFQIDGMEDVTYTFPAGITPGEVHLQPIHLSNTGTGHVRVPVVVEAIAGNGSTLWADTRAYVLQGADPATCNTSNTDLIAAVDWSADGSGTGPFKSISLSTAPWDEFQISAGNAEDLCAIFRLGATNADYAAGGTAISWAWRMDAFYP